MLPLSFEKLAYLHIGSRFNNHTYHSDSCIIKQACYVKHLGVIFSDTLVFKEHINNICKKSNAFCRMISRSFESRIAYFLISLFNMYVRPQLEYASTIWSPHLKMDIAKLKRVQRMYTKRIPVLRHLSYVERMAYVGTRSFEHRRLYFDLLYLYKVLHSLLHVTLDNVSITPSVSRQALRNHGFGLNPGVAFTSQKFYGFAYRACKLGNLLPNKILQSPFGRFRNLIYRLHLIDLYHTGH